MDSLDGGRGVDCFTGFGVATRVAISNVFTEFVLIAEWFDDFKSLVLTVCCGGTFGVLIAGDGTGFKILGDACGMAGGSFFSRSAPDGDCMTLVA